MVSYSIQVSNIKLVLSDTESWIAGYNENILIENYHFKVERIITFKVGTIFLNRTDKLNSRIG